MLLLLLAETGFRIGELLGVRYVEDIDYQGCRIRVEPRVDNENEVRANMRKTGGQRLAKILLTFCSFTMLSTENYCENQNICLLHYLEYMPDKR